MIYIYNYQNKRTVKRKKGKYLRLNFRREKIVTSKLNIGGN